MTTKDSPAKALIRLAAFLKSRGAEVKVIYLPSADGSKVGVDDWVYSLKQAGQDDAAIRSGLFRFAEDHLRQPPGKPGPGNRPVISLHGGQMPRHVDDALKVVGQQHKELRIFERREAKDFVYICADPTERGSNHRPAGGIILKQLTRPMAEDQLTRAIDWRKYSAQHHAEVVIDCPKKAAEIFMSRAGNGTLPELIGVIEAPIMRLDGSILAEPGYDASTGLFFYTTQAWPDIPERPTRDDAVRAAAVLREPLAQFPFVKVKVDSEKGSFIEPARSVVVAALFTGIQRRLLPSAPLALTLRGNPARS